jgi:hypothetical protein
MTKIPLWSRIILGMIIVAILSTSLIFASNYLAQKSANNNNNNKEYDYAWTKAICNETHCQDYEIICKDKKVISQNPISGAAITIDNDWDDPRDESFRNKLCE